MSGPTSGSQDSSPTNVERRELYQRRSQASLRLLAALGGLSVIATGDLAGSNLTRWWPPLIVMSLLMTGASLGLGWSSFSYAEARLARLIDRDAAAASRPWQPGRQYDPTRGERLYKTGIILLTLAGLLVILAFWSSAVRPS